MPRLVALILCLLTGIAQACGVIAQGPNEFVRVLRASSTEDQVAFSFLGHASFLIRTPGGVTVVTEYNGSNLPSFPPDIATMSSDRENHATANPDPRISHVLHGWRDDGKPADHELTVGDLRVRNLPTNIRSWSGEGTRAYGNSIFIFETAGLCIAHLGHLHHLLDLDDLATLGQVDIVMAPLDGRWTLSQEDMAKVLDQLHPRIVLAMHYWGKEMLNRFAERVADHYRLVVSASDTITVSRATLPPTPELIVLPGSYY